MRVHQILSGTGPHDAITSEARYFRGLFERWGWGGLDWAARRVPTPGFPVRPLEELRAEGDDVLLIHHSAATPRLERVLALPNPKLAHYHNITPADWLWDEAPVVAAHCAVGRQQLAPLVHAADACSADSRFNAAEMEALGAREVTVIPLPIDPGHLGPPGEEPGGPATVIFVGRLSPHKRQEQVIRVFAGYRREHDPHARLTLIGDPISGEHLSRLREVAATLAPGAVSIESGLGQAELAERYRRAHVMLCLSAHEGFCIPVVEAFHFGVPVVAQPSGAIPEVAGDAAILVEDEDLAVLAETVHLTVSDRELREELRRRGRRRLSALALERVQERLREAVTRCVRTARGR